MFSPLFAAETKITFAYNFVDPLMKVAVPIAKNVLAPLGITAAASASDTGIQKKIHGYWYNNFNNFEWRNEWYNENYSSSWKF